MAHFCYQDYGRLTVEDITKASRVNEVFQKMWRILFKSVQPKTHTWDHLIVNLNRMRGLKQHTESPCEVEHQIGKAMEGRFSGRDKERSVKAIAQSRANQRLNSVQDQKQKVAEASKRNFSTPREERNPTERITIDDLEAAADEYNWKMTSVQDLEMFELDERYESVCSE